MVPNLTCVFNHIMKLGVMIRVQADSWVPPLAFASRSGGWGRAYYTQRCQKEQSSCSWGHIHRWRVRGAHGTQHIYREDADCRKHREKNLFTPLSNLPFYITAKQSRGQEDIQLCGLDAHPQFEEFNNHYCFSSVNLFLSILSFSKYVCAYAQFL